MAKQVTSIQIGAYFHGGMRYNNLGEAYSDRFTPFDGYPKEFGVWNINYRADMEFIDTPTSKALSGYERGNPGGHRLIVDLALKNTSSSETSNIKSLLDLVPSQYERVMATTNISGAPTYDVNTNTSDVLLGSNIVNFSNAYQGAYVRNINRNDTTFRCTRFSVNPQKFDLRGNTNAVSWQDGDDLNVILFPDKPTVIGISTDNTTSNIIYCNLISSTFGIERELTIGNQIISMSLRSVDRFQTIPANIEI